MSQPHPDGGASPDGNSGGSSGNSGSNGSDTPPAGAGPRTAVLVLQLTVTENGNPREILALIGADVNQADLTHYIEAAARALFPPAYRGAPPASSSAIAAIPKVLISVRGGRPLAQSTLAQLSTHVCDAGDLPTCSICFEVLGHGLTVSRLGCGHMYHTSCVSQWLVRSNTCPDCRRPIESPSPAAADTPIAYAMTAPASGAVSAPATAAPTSPAPATAAPTPSSPAPSAPAPAPLASASPTPVPPASPQISPTHAVASPLPSLQDFAGERQPPSAEVIVQASGLELGEAPVGPGGSSTGQQGPEFATGSFAASQQPPPPANRGIGVDEPTLSTASPAVNSDILAATRTFDDEHGRADELLAEASEGGRLEDEAEDDDDESEGEQRIGRLRRAARDHANQVLRALDIALSRVRAEEQREVQTAQQRLETDQMQNRSLTSTPAGPPLTRARRRLREETAQALAAATAPRRSRRLNSNAERPSPQLVEASAAPAAEPIASSAGNSHNHSRNPRHCRNPQHLRRLRGGRRARQRVFPESEFRATRMNQVWPMNFPVADSSDDIPSRSGTSQSLGEDRPSTTSSRAPNPSAGTSDTRYHDGVGASAGAGDSSGAGPSSSAGGIAGPSAGAGPSSGLGPAGSNGRDTAMAPPPPSGRHSDGEAGGPSNEDNFEHEVEVGGPRTETVNGQNVQGLDSSHHSDAVFEDRVSPLSAVDEPSAPPQVASGTLLPEQVSQQQAAYPHQPIHAGSADASIPVVARMEAVATPVIESRHRLSSRPIDASLMAEHRMALRAAENDELVRATLHPSYVSPPQRNPDLGLSNPRRSSATGGGSPTGSEEEIVPEDRRQA